MAVNVGLNAAQLHDDLLASMVDGARHDADLCPFCRGDLARQDESRASVPSGTTPSGASPSSNDPTTEGGTTHTMSETASISKETHEALLAKAVSDATSATEKALERKTTEAADLASKTTDLEKRVQELTDDNARLNKELDTAQVSLKKATDEVASLQADIAAKDQAARIAELASKRADQVKNLDLFPADYITEKASKWAALSDEDWADRIDEWSKAKPAAKPADAKTDTSSAMTGTSGDLTTDVASESTKQTPARRAVLGLA